MPVQCYLTNCL